MLRSARRSSTSRKLSVKLMVRPDGVADDFGWEAVASIP